MKSQIDRLDKKILSMITQDARVPYLEVARECGVSGAAIHQRVQKLEQMGVLQGSAFMIDTYRIGYCTCAYIGIMINDLSKYNAVVKALSNIQEIVECHSVTGHYALMVKVYAKNNRDLRDIIIKRISKIDGISGTETLQISLDELFSRQLAPFDNLSDDDHSVLELVD